MARKIMSSRDARRKKKSGYVPKTLQRAKEATYQELERLTDEQIRRVMRTLEIQAGDVRGRLEKKGLSIPMRFPTAPDAKTIRNRAQLIQQIQVHRAYIEAGQRTINTPRSPEHSVVSRSIIQEATEILFDAYEGNIEWFYVESAVVKVTKDGANTIDEIVKKASDILEKRHPEYSGIVTGKITWKG